MRKEEIVSVHSERPPAVNSTLMQLSRRELDAVARQLSSAHEKRLTSLENELGDRLYNMIDTFRRTYGVEYHPQCLDKRVDLSL